MGAWAGTLEYRDYSEPATSTKRVKLPTWLNVEPAAPDLGFRYIYDAGPTKTVKEISVIGVDPSRSLYTVSDSAGKLEDSYTIVGLAQLRSGHGILTLNGKGHGEQGCGRGPNDAAHREKHSGNHTRNRCPRTTIRVPPHLHARAGRPAGGPPAGQVSRLQSRDRHLSQGELHLIRFR